MEYPKFDERDADILHERTKRRETRTGPRIGDFIRMLDGRLMRFSHDWGDDIQISEGGSFYLSEGGGLSFSGGLEPPILKSTIVDTGEQRDGWVWFFHHGVSGAHRGVRCALPCRVYRQIETS